MENTPSIENKITSFYASKKIKKIKIIKQQFKPCLTNTKINLCLILGFTFVCYVLRDHAPTCTHHRFSRLYWTAGCGGHLHSYQEKGLGG